MEGLFRSGKGTMQVKYHKVGSRDRYHRHSGTSYPNLCHLTDVWFRGYLDFRELGSISSTTLSWLCDLGQVNCPLIKGT